MKKARGAKAPKAVPEVIPGAVVRDLVDHNEERIAELQAELATAVQRADEAELRVAVLSGDAPSAHPEAHNGKAEGSNGKAAAPPRTTVVSRPRSPEAG